MKNATTGRMTETGRFAVRMTQPRDGIAWWCGDNRWATHQSVARWFQTSSDAELAALRELQMRREMWAVIDLVEYERRSA